jgi:GNAT superfamily N-acetyltransferase
VLTVRGFDFERDYEGLQWLENGIFGSQVSQEELRERDANRDPALGWGRLVALWDWQIVGAIEATQRSHAFPTHSEVKIGVRPDHRRLGIGRALLGALEGSLRSVGGEVMLFYSSEFDSALNTFLWHTGFFETFRGYQQYLDVSRVDLSNIAVDWKRILESGIDFRTLADVRFEWDCAQKLYDLYVTVESDVPRVDTHFAPKSFEAFCADLFDSPASLPEGTWLAVRAHDWGLAYVGCNILYRDSGGTVLHNGLTGVRREERGLGLALALKYKGIEFAQNAGFAGITTFNASTNAAILKLNERLGFERQGATLEWRKTL